MSIWTNLENSEQYPNLTLLKKNLMQNLLIISDLVFLKRFLQSKYYSISL